MMQYSMRAWLAVGGIVWLMSAAPMFAQTVVINEFVASNGGTIADMDGDFEDWIELYNTGLAAVDLDGWGVSDDPENPFRWVFPPATVIEPGEHLLVWASGKDRRAGLAQRPNGILREVYMNITGGGVSDLVNHPSFPDSPTSRQVVTGYFEAPTNIADHYGQRMHGYIKAPVTGNYTFWISGDNGSRLYLSTDENPDNAVGIAEIPGTGWSDYPRHWTRYPQQRSNPVALTEGQYYYICALMKEDVGGDHLAVRWELPNGQMEEPIPTSRLYVDPEELHTNFAISAAGEPLLLTAPDGTVIDSVDPVELIRDVSYGRATDGGQEWVYFAEPTPRATNNNAVASFGIMPSPEFSHESGYYADPFDVTLMSEDPQAQIYYTLDGSMPDADNLSGTAYGYKNQYPSGEMLFREYRSFSYESPLHVAQRQPNGLKTINTENSSGTSTPGNNWSIENDELVQSSLAQNVRLMFGDPDWTDYEITLQARKDSGAEGFLIFFRASGNRYYFVNFGGWSNTLHGIEKGIDNGSWSIFIPRVSGSVNTNQWYDIRIRTEGNRFWCWLDDTLVFDFSDDTATPYMFGGVGVGTWATRSRYRNIEVRSLGGDVLYSGLPDIASDGTSGTTVVRARAHKPGYIPSEIVTRTYFLDTPPAQRHNLPVVSLAVEEPDFFGYDKGIYVAGANYNNTGNYWMRGELWERPVHVTLFEPDGTVALAQNVGARIHGGWTRNLPQKTLRLYARSGYGDAEFDYPVFPGLQTETFKRLLLRNSGNDNGQTFFRDAMMQRLVEHLPIDTQAYRPAVLYINGEYWGINNLRERFDKYYLYYKYGVDPEQLDILDYQPNVSHSVKQGDAVHFDETLSYIQTHGLTDPTDYAYIQTRIDTDNFIDNNVSQIYFNNTDWPGNNNDWWRSRTDSYEPGAPYGHDGRWRWMLYDTDFGFGHSGGYTANTLEFATDDSKSGWPNPHWSTYLLRKLLENETFRTDFVNRYADLMNTAFLPERVVGVIDEMQAAIAPEMPNHIARWGRPGSIGGWNDQVNVTRNFANQRPAYARAHLRSKFDLGEDRQLMLNVSDAAHGFVRVNRTDINADTPGVNAAVPYPWSGLYFDSLPVTVTAVARPGYRFTHWDGPAGIDPDAETLTLALTETVSLTANFEEKPAPSLMHYWSFNDTLALMTPTYSFGGAAMNILPGLTTEVTSGTGQDFAGLNNRLEEVTGAHLRVNNPIGAVMTLSLPTTGYEEIVVMYETRRSGQGAGTQQISYSLDGTTFEPFGFIYVYDAAPVLHTFDFSEIPAADNNPDFALRIEFEQGSGNLTGNNRFDNITVDGIPLGGVNQPPYLEEALPFIQTREDAAPTGLDLTAYFADPDNDQLVFTALSNKPFVAEAILSDGVLTLVPQMRGDAVIALTADDGINPPFQASIRVLVYPEAKVLRLGQFRFEEWSADQPEHTFPDHMLFLQSNVSDPGLTETLEYAYFIPHDDYQAVDFGVIGYPYSTSGRTRLSGLYEFGISFINTGRGRDLGGALVALDTTGLEGVRVNWLAGTILRNVRQYAIRLQYRVGIDGPFMDVLDDGQPVEYSAQTDGDMQTLDPVDLPSEAVDQPYVQLLWRYYHVDGDSGARSQLRLDDIAVSGKAGIFEDLGLFAQWWLVTDCLLYDHCAGADLTRDGIVNLEDFAIVAAQWLEL